MPVSRERFSSSSCFSPSFCVCFIAYGRHVKYFAFWVNRFSFLWISVLAASEFLSSLLISHQVLLVIWGVFFFSSLSPTMPNDFSFRGFDNWNDTSFAFWRQFPFRLGCSLRLLWRSSSLVAVHLSAIGALPLHTPPSLFSFLNAHFVLPFDFWMVRVVALKRIIERNGLGNGACACGIVYCVSVTECARCAG